MLTAVGVAEKLGKKRRDSKPCCAPSDGITSWHVSCAAVKLDYGTMTWNTNEVPCLALVWQSVDSCNRTLAIWQRSEADRQRQRLIQLHHDLDDEEKSFRERADEPRIDVER